jgi:hypothetical protein
MRQHIRTLGEDAWRFGTLLVGRCQPGNRPRIAKTVSRACFAGISCSVAVDLQLATHVMCADTGLECRSGTAALRRVRSGRVTNSAAARSLRVEADDVDRTLTDIDADPGNGRA